MKLQDQVCTQKQAKRLAELGVVQEGCFSWGCNDEFDNMEPATWTLYAGKHWIYKRYSAFTVAELSVMLPDYYPSWRFKVSESSDERKWIATVICSPKPPGIDDIHTANEFDRYAKTQAEALATLLIALLDIKYITPDEVNARLCAE